MRRIPQERWIRVDPKAGRSLAEYSNKKPLPLRRNCYSHQLWEIAPIPRGFVDIASMPTLTRTSRSRPVLGVTPEGPYESRDGDLVRNLANSDAGDFLELFEELQREAARLLSLSPGQREMRMITHLVRSHLAARLVTSSSLAAASGLSYGTAIRTITRMDERGLIVRRTRTSSGKSVSLHPSAELLARRG